MTRRRKVYVPVRLADTDEKRLIALMRWGDWNRSEAIRFSLDFTHIMMSIIPAAVIDTLLDEQMSEE